MSEVRADAIHVSAVLMRDRTGRVLNVRKRGTRMLMLPGGKPEPGEAAADTARREFLEELGVELSPQHLSFMGEFRAPAANETGRDVIAQVFEHPLVDGMEPNAEIDLIQWVHPTDRRADLAPLNTEHIFPLLT